MKRSGLLICLLSLLGVLSAYAHKPSDSYLFLKLEGEKLFGQWDVALRDLEHAVQLDKDQDGAITWAEAQERQPEIDRYCFDRVRFRVNGEPSAPRIFDHQVDYHSDGCYLVTLFELPAPGPIQKVEVDYRLFFDLDAQHRGLLNFEWGTEPLIHTQTAIFSPTQSTHAFNLDQPESRGRQLRRFVREGVWHIWLGYDHILFLIALLIPAVLRRDHGGWQPVASFHRAFLNVLKIVTAFTIAHSITLGLAAAELVQLPSRLVESAIAASVLIVALNNIFPFFSDRSWLVAFGFGLIHGFGFANVLRDLGLREGSFAVTLLGFNLGVELGQLGIVGAFLPLAYGLRTAPVYRWVLLRGASAMVVLVSARWMAERIWGV